MNTGRNPRGGSRTRLIILTADPARLDDSTTERCKIQLSDTKLRDDSRDRAFQGCDGILCKLPGIPVAGLSAGYPFLRSGLSVLEDGPPSGAVQKPTATAEVRSLNGRVVGSRRTHSAPRDFSILRSYPKQNVVCG